MFVKVTDNCVVDSTKVAAIYMRNNNTAVQISLVNCDPVILTDPNNDSRGLFDKVAEKLATTGVKQSKETVPACMDCIYRVSAFPVDMCMHVHGLGSTCESCRKDPEMCGESGKWFREGRVTPM